MNSIKKLKPCAECPFRCKSAPGWLGDHENASEIIEIIRADQKFPCHLQVNDIKQYLIHAFNDDGAEHDCLHISDDMAFKEALKEASHCVGALAFMNVTGKLSRNHQISELQRQVGIRNDVFKSEQEMRTHHDRSRSTLHVISCKTN